jgi:Arc/MetJ-type ribon-helix-helix transcriptional regulator
METKDNQINVRVSSKMVDRIDERRRNILGLGRIPSRSELILAALELFFQLPNLECSELTKKLRNKNKNA